jgi:dTMP kinase
VRDGRQALTADKGVIMSGKIVVFEGIDGSGKSTQAKRAMDFLGAKGIRSVFVHFPLYQETFFGKEVANYLNGQYGGLEETHPKLTAVLYAGDRFEKKDFLLREKAEGTFILLDRYVPSNIAHQGAKLPESEFGGFQKWVEELEYGVFGLPRPDLSLMLDMPPGVTDSLVLGRESRDYTDKKQDLHEADKAYLSRVYRNYVKMAADPGWEPIVCHANGLPRSVEEIGRDIEGKLEAIL